MPKRLKKIFEKEYEAKGYSKAKADQIFYGWWNKKKKKYNF